MKIKRAAVTASIAMTMLLTLGTVPATASGGDSDFDESVEPRSSHIKSVTHDGIQCTLQIDNPHDSNETTGFWNVHAKWDCRSTGSWTGASEPRAGAPVANLFIDVQLYRNSGLANNVTGSKTDTWNHRLNAPHGCTGMQNNVAKWQGIADGSVTFPDGTTRTLQVRSAVVNQDKCT